MTQKLGLVVLTHPERLVTHWGRKNERPIATALGERADATVNLMIFKEK